MEEQRNAPPLTPKSLREQKNLFHVMLSTQANSHHQAIGTGVSKFAKLLMIKLKRSAPAVSNKQIQGAFDHREKLKGSWDRQMATPSRVTL